MADHMEKRPPTQLQNSNMCFSSMPTPHRVDVGRHRDEVIRHGPLIAQAVDEHCRAVWAFSIVSWVVNDFEATTNSVVSGGTCRSAVVTLVG